MADIKFFSRRDIVSRPRTARQPLYPLPWHLECHLAVEKHSIYLPCDTPSLPLSELAPRGCSGVNGGAEEARAGPFRFTRRTVKKKVRRTLSGIIFQIFTLFFEKICNEWRTQSNGFNFCYRGKRKRVCRAVRVRAFETADTFRGRSPNTHRVHTHTHAETHAHTHSHTLRCWYGARRRRHAPPLFDVCLSAGRRPRTGY